MRTFDPPVPAPPVPPPPFSDIARGQPRLRRQLTSHKYEHARRIAETLVRLGRGREGLSFAIAEHFGLISPASPFGKCASGAGSGDSSHCLFYVTLGPPGGEDVLQARASAQGRELLVRRPLPASGRCSICQHKSEEMTGADAASHLTGWDCCGEAYCVPCPQETARMERNGVPRWARLTRVCFCASIDDFV